MIIKKISCTKSRTICVDGIFGRDKYRKLSIFLEVEPETIDEKNNTDMCYETLSDKIDRLMEIEIEKLNNLIKKK